MKALGYSSVTAGVGGGDRAEKMEGGQGRKGGGKLLNFLHGAIC